MLPCNKVFDIPELLDDIRRHLYLRNIKACSLVCRRWNSHFCPYLWRSFSLASCQRTQDKMGAIQRRGRYIVFLKDVHASNKILVSIQTSCLIVKEMELMLTDTFSWISYRTLESFFTRMTSLTSLSLTFNATRFSFAMLWSLSQARHLLQLNLYVYYPKRVHFKTADHTDFLSVIDCCAHIPSISLAGAFMEPRWLGVKESWGAWAQQMLQCLDFTPPSLCHAREPRSHTWASILRWPSSSDVYCCSPSVTSLRSIRRLHMEASFLSTSGFRALIEKCPLLEVLHIDVSIFMLPNSIWNMLAAQCPRLRVLSVLYANAAGSLPSQKSCTRCSRTWKTSVCNP
ncbi:MAG: hypothetical protein BYD32DRAFT_425583 [Podila humilis]|nr:MAG: hypothetical protein BYD32DRAFT_425583 [Podila humilis]